MTFVSGCKPERVFVEDVIHSENLCRPITIKIMDISSKNIVSGNLHVNSTVSSTVS